MYELGRAEALTWALEAGFPQAKGCNLERRTGPMAIGPTPKPKRR
jgi:hypothetical protein